MNAEPTVAPPPAAAANTADEYRRGPHWVAVFAALFTFPLLLVGGTVTTYGVGLAVPDWPTTFGMNMFLYNFWNSAWGVFIEHSHRLYGSAVGFLTIILAVYFQWRDRRPWMKALGWITLLAVIVQGILGGQRVRLMSTPFAAVHGCTALAIFALMVALCVLTGRRWIGAGPRRPDPEQLRVRSILLVALVYAQVIAGASLRHYGAGLAVHAALAVVVLLAAGYVGLRALAHRAEAPELAPSARAVIGLVVLQVALGVGAWWSMRPLDGTPRRVTTYQAMLRTGHQSNAALLLGASLVLALRASRHLGPASSAQPNGPRPPVRSSAPADAPATAPAGAPPSPVTLQESLV